MILTKVREGHASFEDKISSYMFLILACIQSNSKSNNSIGGLDLDCPSLHGVKKNIEYHIIDEKEKLSHHPVTICSNYTGLGNIGNGREKSHDS